MVIGIHRNAGRIAHNHVVRQLLGPGRIDFKLRVLADGLPIEGSMNDPRSEREGGSEVGDQSWLHNDLLSVSKGLSSGDWELNEFPAVGDHRTWLKPVGATVCPRTKVSGVWPSTPMVRRQ